eukprot:7945045-Pyramimonas_sp.AAC.1
MAGTAFALAAKGGARSSPPESHKSLSSAWSTATFCLVCLAWLTATFLWPLGLGVEMGSSSV